MLPYYYIMQYRISDSVATIHGTIHLHWNACRHSCMHVECTDCSYPPTLNVPQILANPYYTRSAITCNIVSIDRIYFGIWNLPPHLLTSLLQVIYWAPDELSSQMSWALPHGGYDARQTEGLMLPCLYGAKIGVTIQLCVRLRVCFCRHSVGNVIVVADFDREQPLI